MRKTGLAALTLLGLLAALPSAHAAACANGVYRAGCAGPNGAAVVRKPYAYPQGYYHGRYYRPPPVSCASGPYRAGCAGPNGAAVVRKRY
jgi:hypothetical protein